MLNITDPETQRLAEELARRTGKTVAEAVRHALEDWVDRTPPPPPAPHEIDWAKIRAIQAHMRAHMPAGMTSDHSDLYGDDGLPA